MPNEPKPHLDEPQLLRSVVDATGLSLAERQHLAHCAVCQGEQQRLQTNLATLGKMAEHFAPAPRTPLRLSALQARSHHDRPRQSLLKWTAVAATVAVMTVGPWLLHVRQVDQVAAVNREMRQDERLLLAVNRLEKNALPAFYLEITGDDQSDEVAPNVNGKDGLKLKQHSSPASTRKPEAHVEKIARRHARC